MPTVLVERLQVFEAFVLAHDLHNGGEERVGGAGGVRIGHLNLVLQLRIEEVRPAFRLRNSLRLNLLDVVAEAEGARVDADRPVLRLLPLAHGPVL